MGTQTHSAQAGAWHGLARYYRSRSGRRRAVERAVLLNLRNTLSTKSELDAHWRIEANKRIARMDLRSIGTTERTGKFLKRDLGDVLMTDWDSPSVEGVRSAKDGRGGEEAMLLFTASAGKQVMDTASGSAVLEPGTVLLANTREPGKFIIPHFVRKQSVRIPSSALIPFLAKTSMPDSLILRTADSPWRSSYKIYCTG